MQLISDIQIEGFRSIRRGEISGLGGFTAVAGLNNAGKSNVLRALSAFFTGNTDPGRSLLLSEDYFRPDLRQKKAKRIRISVRFDLPTWFYFRKGLEGPKTLLGDKNFRITKEWNRDRSQVQPAYYLNDEGPLDSDDRHKVDQFLQLINFRYVPNRVLPIDVIRQEHEGLRDVLVRRLGRSAKAQKQAFDAIRNTSKNLIEGLAERVRELHPAIGGVRLATPASWSEMVFAFGYLLEQGDVEFEDAVQGSGIQSLLMLETLYLIDLDYYQKFGWKQASLWCIEEPESSLHSSLEAQVAAFLSGITTRSTSRLQVFATTHSDLMLQYADRAVLVESQDNVSTLRVSADVKEVLQEAARAGVSRWAHPILHYPRDPLILVAGKTDRVFLQAAFRQMRPKKQVQVRDLEEVGDLGGDDALVKYIKGNRDAIKTRSKDAPVIVVLDWDAAGKRSPIEANFKSENPIRVLVWPDSSFNPYLDKSFKGLERHLPTSLIEAAEQAAGLDIPRRSNGQLSIAKEDLGRLKAAVHQLIREDGLGSGDLTHAETFLRDVLQAAGAK